MLRVVAWLFWAWLVAAVSIQTPAAAVTIMPMGDSITRGYQGRVASRGSYRAELEELFTSLEVEFDFVGDLNFARDGLKDGDVQAISGYRVEQMVDEFGAAVARHQPDIVLLLAGTNNHHDPTNFKSKYDELIELIEHNSPASRIVASTIPPFGCCRDEPHWTPAYVSDRNDHRIPMINKAIAEVSQLNPKIDLVDLNSAIDASAGDLVDGDWVHLTGAGHEKLSMLFLTAIASYEYAVFDASTIDLVARQESDLVFDFDGSGQITLDDHETFVTQLMNTYIGDSDLNGEFGTGDLVRVFVAGEYEDDVPRNSGWLTGDWNGDREFDSSDFVRAFQSEGYEIGKRVPATPADSLVSQSVPEPVGLFLLPWALLASVLFRR